ncbi:MAG TPA: TolC family protein [Candidatus Acidoferrales bacterium]|jgi:outer membrane protein TolC|nr:TolC family protein [Candidatus Acidoferrales bacterium]
MRFRLGGLGIALFAASFPLCARAQNAEPAPRHITLSEAVQLALKQNHVVRIAGLQVQEKQHAKEAARSGYFPGITNETRILQLTDTQFIQIPAGSLGTVAGSPVPAAPAILNQGSKTFITSGTGLVQPLTQLFTKVKPSNDLARADLDATRANEKETENEVALRVHQIYYQVLVTQLHRSATEAKIRAAQDMESERVQQVKYGSTLDEQLIESRAQTLEAKQDLLTTELQLSDLTMQLNDVLGLPVTTQLELDPTVPEVQEPCHGEECVRAALASHPEIVAARAEVEKASAAVRLAKADYFPDVSAVARYSYQDNVPFLARNFGTFGAELTYDLFDGGRRKAKLGESNAGLGQARENLARISDEVERRVDTVANKLARTRQMVQVSQEILALRSESSRVSAQQLERGEALPSQSDAAIAQEFDAKTRLLQSQLDHVMATDEMIQAIGLTPK